MENKIIYSIFGTSSLFIFNGTPLLTGILCNLIKLGSLLSYVVEIRQRMSTVKRLVLTILVLAVIESAGKYEGETEKFLKEAVAVNMRGLMGASFYLQN